MRTRSSSSLPIIGGCTGGFGGCLGIILVNLLLGSFAARYCLWHWLPLLHVHYPSIGLLDPNASVWSFKLMLLGLFGGELFIPGAIVTWLLIGLGIVAV